MTLDALWPLVAVVMAENTPRAEDCWRTPEAAVCRRHLLQAALAHFGRRLAREPRGA